MRSRTNKKSSLLNIGSLGGIIDRVSAELATHIVTATKARIARDLRAEAIPVPERSRVPLSGGSPQKAEALDGGSQGVPVPMMLRKSRRAVAFEALRAGASVADLVASGLPKGTAEAYMSLYRRGKGPIRKAGRRPDPNSLRQRAFALYAAGRTRAEVDAELGLSSGASHLYFNEATRGPYYYRKRRQAGR